MNEKRNFDYKKLHPFKWYILENFPFLEDSIDALTNYQLFCKLGEMYNKQVDSINTLGVQVEALTDWFDNLDVQDEINNKLDKMAEDGTLSQLIGAYVDPELNEIRTDIDEFKENVNSNLESINTEVSQLASGSPLVASSVSEMTDTSRIYVNTSDGKWYYYNGSAWTVGGIYQSTSNQSQVNLIQELLNNYGVTFDIVTEGSSLTTNLWIEGGKTYRIERLSGDNSMLGQLFIEGHPSEATPIPYVGAGTNTWSPIYSGFMRFYNASASTGTITIRIKGEFDDIATKAEENNNYIHGFDITATGTTDAYLRQGEKAKIIVNSNTSATNLFMTPYDAGTYITLSPGSGTYYYTADKDGYIGIQNSGTTISAKIFTLNGIVQEINEDTSVYVVDKDGNGDYTSFTEMEEDLKNDFSEKIVYVNNGTYDIYEELGGDNFISSITNPSSTNWREVCKIVPPNTHIIGLGNATLKFTPEDSQIGSNEMAFLFSPLNVSYSCTIENINVEAKNCRYAIHDESSGLSEFNNTIHKYINVRAKKEHGTFGNAQCFGSGLARNCYWTFDNCKFISDSSNIFTVHTVSSQASDVANITITNCIFANTDESAMTNTETIQFISGIASSHLSILNNVTINNSYVTGKIALTGDSGAVQRYKLTMLKTTSNGVVVSPDFSSNPYTPEIYQ